MITRQEFYDSTMLQSSPKAKIRLIVHAYQSGEISLGKAADLTGLSQEEMKEVLREEEVEIHFGPQTAEEALEDARNAG